MRYKIQDGSHFDSHHQVFQVQPRDSLITLFSPVAQREDLAMRGGKLFFAFIESPYHVFKISGGWELLTGLAFFWQPFFKMAAIETLILNISGNNWHRIMILESTPTFSWSLEIAQKHCEACQTNIWCAKNKRWVKFKMAAILTGTRKDFHSNIWTSANKRMELVVMCFLGYALSNNDCKKIVTYYEP